MNHIQLNFNVNNQNINFDVDAVYAQFCQGNNNIQICLNSKHSDKYIFYTLRFDCSFAAANTIKPQLL